MLESKPGAPLPEDQKKEVFLALVEAQDRGISVPQSRKDTAAQFGITETQVRQIEREGMEAQWPPL